MIGRVSRDMLLSLRRFGGVRASIRRFGAIRILDAGLREVWLRSGMRIIGAVRPNTRHAYGALEAFLFPASDYWLRYAEVLTALADLNLNPPLRMLEVSSGRGGIAWFLRQSGFQICLVDSTAALLRDSLGGNAWRVCADGARLPFSDRSFEVVVSVDTLEHLPRENRRLFLEELKRIAVHAVILTCPMDSVDGEFQARTYDTALMRDIESRHSVLPGWLQDHMQKGHPYREELCDAFPGARVRGTQNGEKWIEYAKMHQRPLRWVLSGLRYRQRIQKEPVAPPYCRGVMVWLKDRTENLRCERRTASADSETPQPVYSSQGEYK